MKRRHDDINEDDDDDDNDFDNNDSAVLKFHHSKNTKKEIPAKPTTESIATPKSITTPKPTKTKINKTTRRHSKLYQILSKCNSHFNNFPSPKLRVRRSTQMKMKFKPAIFKNIHYFFSTYSDICQLHQNVEKK